MPVALPPPGDYPVSIATVDDGGAVSGVARIGADGRLALVGGALPAGMLRIVF
jgi:hypothetical protein